MKANIYQRPFGEDVEGHAWGRATIYISVTMVTFHDNYLSRCDTMYHQLMRDAAWDGPGSQASISIYYNFNQYFLK